MGLFTIQGAHLKSLDGGVKLIRRHLVPRFPHYIVTIFRDMFSF